MSSVGAKINEPSMEDILASIRRIIADDQETLQIVQGAVEAREGSPLRNVLDLTEQHISAEILPVPADIEPDTAFEFLEDEEVPSDETPVADFPVSSRNERPAPFAKAPARATRREMTEEALLSDATNTSVLDSFDRLGASMVQSSPKTLEDLAKEMLRPMLKTWLDDNLPLLVERLVQAEIERIARSRR